MVESPRNAERDCWREIKSFGAIVGDGTDELALIGRCMAGAARYRASVAMEIDRVDPAVNFIVDALPVEWEADWITFVR